MIKAEDNCLHMYMIIERVTNVDNIICLFLMVFLYLVTVLYIFINLTVFRFQGFRLSTAWHAPHDFPELFGSSYKFINSSRDEGWEKKKVRWTRTVVNTNNVLHKRGRCRFSCPVTIALSKIEAPATGFPNHIRLI